MIREAERRDIPAISNVARKTYAETFGDGLTPEQLEYILESTRSEAYFNSVFDDDLILVALKEKQVVGYIQISAVRYKVEGIEVNPSDQAIHAIYIDSEYQGRGIGLALMDAAFKHHRIKTADKIFIDVYEENTRALNFYKKYGFKQVGTVNVIVDDIIIGYDLVLMKENR